MSQFKISTAFPICSSPLPLVLSRELTFSQGGEEIVLSPQGLLRLKVTASKEDGRNKFTFRVTWQDEEHMKRGKKLKISSGK